MIVTTILAMALTAQAAKAQAPPTEQQRLKALAAKIHRESLAKKPQVKPKPKPVAPAPIVIQYVDVPNVETGARLYVWTEGLERVPICTDLFRAESLQKAMLADNQEALDEAITRERLPYVTREAAVRVVHTLGSSSRSSVAMDTTTFMMELRAANLPGAPKKPRPVCEVRILDGPFKGQTGWISEYLLRERVEINLKKTKRHR